MLRKLNIEMKLNEYLTEIKKTIDLANDYLCYSNSDIDEEELVEQLKDSSVAIDCVKDLVYELEKEYER